MQIEFINKQLIKQIKILRTEREKEFANDSEQLLHQFYKDLVAKINQSQADNKQFNTETYICNSFSWSSKVTIKPYLKSWINQNSSERLNFQNKINKNPALTPKWNYYKLKNK